MRESNLSTDFSETRFCNIRIIMKRRKGKRKSASNSELCNCYGELTINAFRERVKRRDEANDMKSVSTLLIRWSRYFRGGVIRGRVIADK